MAGTWSRDVVGLAAYQLLYDVRYAATPKITNFLQGFPPAVLQIF